MQLLAAFPEEVFKLPPEFLGNAIMAPRGSTRRTRCQVYGLWTLAAKTTVPIVPRL